MTNVAKILTICVLSISFVLELHSQHVISGIIIKEDNTPIEYATVKLQVQDSTINTTLSDEKGNFSIEAPIGKFSLRFFLLGNQIFNQEIDVMGSIDLGSIIVKATDVTLSEVTISARKKTYTRKLDRIIFNVENSISAIGGTALEVLKVTPRVRVQNQQVSLVGRNTMQVMVNDKLIPLTGEDLISYLKSIASQDIKKVEVIPNPPAKYDAEGSNGLINIVLKKREEEQLFLSTLRGGYTQATYPTGNLGTSLNIRQKKITLSASLDARKGSVKSIETAKYFYPQRIIFENNTSRDFSNYLSGNLSLDYEINDANSISIAYRGSYSQPEQADAFKTDFSTTQEQLESFLMVDADQVTKKTNHILDAYYHLKLDSTGKKAIFSLGYIDYSSDDERVYVSEDFLASGELIENSFDSQRNLSNQGFNIFNSNLDFKFPMNDWNLEFGGKAVFINNDSDVSLFDESSGGSIFDPTQSNQFRYQENTQALYVSMDRMLGEKWEFKAGLRLENTQTEGISESLNEPNKINYTRLFPTLYIDFIPNDDHAFNLTYGKRISRPRFTMLNPFRWYSNPYSYIEGNPFLQPSFNHNIELSHTLFDNLYTTFFYTYVDNDYDLITNTDPNSQLIISRSENFFNSHEIGANMSYTFYIGDVWESYLEASAYYNRARSFKTAIKNNQGWGGDIMFTNALTFNKSRTLLGNLDLNYSFPGAFGVINTEDQLTISSGFKSLLLDKRLILSLNFYDMFRTAENGSVAIVNGLRTRNTYYGDARRVIMSISYTFGNKRVRAKSQKRGNSEERRRVN